MNPRSMPQRYLADMDLPGSYETSYVPKEYQRQYTLVYAARPDLIGQQPGALYHRPSEPNRPAGYQTAAEMAEQARADALIQRLLGQPVR